jgi:hypothetical protein
MGRSVLFAVREVGDDTFHVLGRGHEHIHGLEVRLSLSVIRNGFDHWGKI